MSGPNAHCKVQLADDADLRKTEYRETDSAESEDDEEWQPKACAAKRRKTGPLPKKSTMKRPPVQKPAKPKDQKPKVPRKVNEKKPRTPRVRKKDSAAPVEKAVGVEKADYIATESSAAQVPVKVKEERVSFQVPAGWTESGPSQQPLPLKEEEDYDFDQPATKTLKTSEASKGKPVRRKEENLRYDLQMNWDPIQLLSQMTQVEPWVCTNIVDLFEEENTIPFMVRYRKELINNMDADGVREVQRSLWELCAVSKKSQSIRQTLKKEGVLTTELEDMLKSCRTLDELDDLYVPYKKGSKLSKARRARMLGLEPAALALLQDPLNLNLQTFVKPDCNGLSTLEEVSMGVGHILADIIAKDKETMTCVRNLCDCNLVTLQSSVTKTALKEQGKKGVPQRGFKDIDKFHLYYNFTSNVQRIQHHQTLAINRGENLKILTVKVNIPDGVKHEFYSWCMNVRWRPKGYANNRLMEILHDAVKDSFKRLVVPVLSREYRSRLTTSAEKESIAMFVKNLRQRLLVCPMRGCVIMGVDPGFCHGCKLAILSPTSQILHTDVVYLHKGNDKREADKLRDLMVKYRCQNVAIGNGTACRETEAFFAGLITKNFFQPLDVSYCIVNEAGASIYSVSAEAVKEMPDLDPNVRSAVSIGRRVQDPLAELVKIDPKHLGIGTYQHDVSQTALKAALDSVVQECVSFVGVDINICSDTLLRHVAGLSASQALKIVEWREANGPFINREQLKLVKGLGPKTFQQCAGFIRINPENLQSFRRAEEGKAAKPPEKFPTKGRKGKGPASGVAVPNPLDQTCIHPESYDVAMRFLKYIHGDVVETGRPEMKQKVEASVKSYGLAWLAETLDTTPETLQLIVDGLTQPRDFDIRQGFEQAIFKRGIMSVTDLRPGMILTGSVENATLFGAFVDIGVGRSGLIHKSNITLEKLPPTTRRRSLALGPGERVEVKVINVDIPRGRIGLDLIRVLQ